MRTDWWELESNPMTVTDSFGEISFETDPYSIDVIPEGAGLENETEI